MAESFGDRLAAAIARKGTPACVGIDPVFEHLPPRLQTRFAHDQAAGLRLYCRRVLDVVAEHVAVVKINIAFFEVYRGVGVDVYFDIVDAAHRAGLLVIGDVKRGDIGHTSTAYARAHLADGKSPSPDAITLNGYFGVDGVKPFLDVARAESKGIFVLVHTSNASADQLQHVGLSDGGDVAEHMAALVNEWAHTDGMMGDAGLSAVGAVVAPGDVERARRLRTLMPELVFLVPGFGAQGRSVEQVAACFKADGSGAIVNSSRGITFAYERAEYAPSQDDDWDDAIGRACADFVTALKQVHA